MSIPEDSESPVVTPPGQISWAELTTSDPAGAIAYYTQLFGWTTEPFSEDYMMFLQNGVPFAGVLKLPSPDVPTHWKNYVVVADLEAAIARSTSLGGALIWGPEEIPTVGRMAIVQDPQGAVIGLHEQA